MHEVNLSVCGRATPEASTVRAIKASTAGASAAGSSLSRPGLALLTAAATVARLSAATALCATVHAPAPPASEWTEDIAAGNCAQWATTKSCKGAFCHVVENLCA